MGKLTFTGHSKDFSLQDALHDAAQQALGTVTTNGIEFHLVGIKGRLGGPGRPRELWVEIGLGPDDAEEGEGQFTTMALGEEGGEPEEALPRQRPDMTTMALGEEGGEAGQDRPEMTTMALGEEGGEAAS